MSVTGSTENSYVVESQGIRLDRYVAENCSELTRTQAQRLINDGLVRVNGMVVRSSLKLRVGDCVTVVIPPSPSSQPEPEAIPFGILYEDNDVLVIDKPAGLPVHPAPGYPSHTLVNAVLAYLSFTPDTGDPTRPGIIHRLDMNTSGVMLVAKNRTAQADLVGQFKSHAVAKVYLALVQGHLAPEHGVIEAPIGRDTRNRKRMAIADEDRGRPARTRYRVIRHIDNYTLVEAMPETGRTHQIRVHLAAIDHPVVGDSTYGVKSLHFPRQFLHSLRLGFRLPSTGEYIEFESALPPDLEQALSHLES